MNQQIAQLGTFAIRIKVAAMSRLRDDQGEISSWLILAAGLALIALFIGTEIATFAGEVITDITGSRVAGPGGG